MNATSNFFCEILQIKKTTHDQGTLTKLKKKKAAMKARTANSRIDRTSARDLVGGIGLSMILMNTHECFSIPKNKHAHTMTKWR